MPYRLLLLTNKNNPGQEKESKRVQASGMNGVFQSYRYDRKSKLQTGNTLPQRLAHIHIAIEQLMTVSHQDARSLGLLTLLGSKMLV
jgi:hypothetical protein